MVARVKVVTAIIGFPVTICNTHYTRSGVSWGINLRKESWKNQKEKKSSYLLQQHAAFITHLNKFLTEAQLEKVKDGMTYRVFPITYAAYQDMLPNLTTEQKVKIYDWLKQARELAMDEGSSDDKHKVFGKYKGKINNYLSAAGYDMKKEGEEWQKRIKDRKEKSKESK